MHYKPEYVYKLDQGSFAWLDTRLGRLTGTDAHTLTVAGKKDPDGLGAGLVSLLAEKAADYIVGQEGPDISGQFWVNRGTELEPESRNNFTQETFISVDECGFITFGPHGGHSPDGLIGDTGMLEIKCPSAKVLIALHEGAPINPKHIAQMQWGLAITGRELCHYYVYHPRLKPFHQVVERNEKMIENMLNRFHTWEERLTKLIKKHSK
jgi:hypothetical protein